MIKILLFLFSWLLREYVGFQLEKDVLRRPVIYDIPLITPVITVLWIIPLVTSLIIGYRDGGFLELVVLLLLYFLILPEFLGKEIKKMVG